MSQLMTRGRLPHEADTPDGGLRQPLRAGLGVGRCAAALTILALLAPPPTANAVSATSAESTSGSADLGLTAVVGKVSGAVAPIESASVYAYRLADLSLRRVLTDQQGRFTFGELPAGLYKVIAHKPGFVPAVVLLTRATAHAFQELEFELALEDGRKAGSAEDFWSVRQKIPADVLREMTIAQGGYARDQYASDQIEGPLAAHGFQAARIRTEMQALTGVGGFSAAPQAQLTGGLLDVEGRLGGVELDLEGGYRRLAQGARADSPLDGTLGTTSALDVRVQAPGDDTFRVTGHFAQMRRESGGPVDLERYGVEWSGEVGPGRSEVSANYVAESNYYRAPRLAALGGLALPFGSRTIELRGSFDTQLSPHSSLRTGLIYRNRVIDDLTEPVDSTMRIEDRVDLFGLTDITLSPTVVVHLGMLASMLGETYALTPHTGATLHLGDRWRTEAAVRHRFHDTDPRLFSDFIPIYFGGGENRCSEAEADCYRLTLVRTLDHDGEVRVGGLLRQYSDTLRVFFSEDFFDQSDSLFFVQGDHVPEINASLQHRLGPSVLARFTANVARGGGGALAFSDGVYINEIAYLVTTVETHFEHTRTGLELSFHSLGQKLEAVGPQDVLLAPAVDLDRLQLQVTQDLRALMGFSTDWAVLLDMQLSRGTDAYHTASNELRHRVVGGLSVRF
jgi:hypothetical protein